MIVGASYKSILEKKCKIWKQQAITIYQKVTLQLCIRILKI